MREYAKVRARFWTDPQGRPRAVPTILGRLKPGRIPLHRDLRAFVLARDGNRCRRCGSIENLVADHILSRRNGGSHHPENLQALCDRCNAAKVGRFDSRGEAARF
jgi:5-methylcytosine-specific restriction endonuclease McrA